MALTINSLSKQYIFIPVVNQLDSTWDPTNPALSVDVAALEEDVQPVSGDFSAAAWAELNGRYYVRVLVGPGTSFVLADGTYQLWVRFNEAPESPVLPADGLLRVT